MDFNHVNVALEEKRDFTHVSKNLYNWTGYSIWEGTESSSRINEAKSYSTVPSISQPTGSNAPTCSITNHEECVVSNWVGLSKDWNGYDLMFQGGVDAYCDNSSCNGPTGTSSTFAFWKVIDNNNRVAGSNTSCDSFLTNLYQGDSVRMTAKYKPSNDRYYMTIQDVVSNQYCAANYSSIVEPRYAQYIVESPTNGYNNETILTSNVQHNDYSRFVQR